MPKKPSNGVAALTAAERKRRSRQKAVEQAYTDLGDEPPKVEPLQQPKSSATPKVTRQKSDAVQSLLEAFGAARGGLILPPHMYQLTEDAVPYWETITKERAKGDWSDADLVVAAQLAQLHADVAIVKDELSKLIRSGGHVVPSSTGSLTRHPLFDVVKGLVAEELALRRSLRMGGFAAGQPKDTAKAARNERDARDTLSDNNDDLLA